VLNFLDNRAYIIYFLRENKEKSMPRFPSAVMKLI